MRLFAAVDPAVAPDLAVHAIGPFGGKAAGHKGDGRGPVVVAALRRAHLAGYLDAVCTAILADARPHREDELLALIGRHTHAGTGANRRARSCIDCSAPMPATHRRGRPRLRCPDCGGAPWPHQREEAA